MQRDPYSFRSNTWFLTRLRMICAALACFRSVPKPGLLFIIACLLNGGPLLYAQHACSDPGITLTGIAEGGNAVYAIGDVSLQAGGQDPGNPNTADWLLLPTAHIQVMAAVTIHPGAVLRLKSGAVMEVYGDFINKGYLFVEPGATILFYGQVWTNDSTAVLGDGQPAANALPGGLISFIAPRLVIPASLSASACIMTSYSGGNFAQSLDGGGVPLDIVLRIANNNNLDLLHTAAHIEGNIEFAVTGGDIVLHEQDLVFEPQGAYFWSIPDAKDAYLVTNSTESCKGMVRKKGLQQGDNFVFPVGRFEESPAGQRDFCPVLVQNDSATAEDVSVAVKTYAEAQAQGISTGTAPSAQTAHLWQIISAHGGGLTLNMLHHVMTPGSNLDVLFGQQSYAPVSNYTPVATWAAGDGPRGLGNGQGTLGTVNLTSGCYAIRRSVPRCTAPYSWFRKDQADTNNLYRFRLEREGCQIHLYGDLEQVFPVAYMDVERKADTAGSAFETIGRMYADKPYHYRFTDAMPLQGLNTYRLKVQLPDSTAFWSYEVSKYIDCSLITVFPNPVNNKVYVNGLKAGQVIQLYTTEGRMLLSRQALQLCEQIDMHPYAGGNYIMVVLEDGKRIAVKKLVKAEH